MSNYRTNCGTSAPCCVNAIPQSLRNRTVEEEPRFICHKFPTDDRISEMAHLYNIMKDKLYFRELCHGAMEVPDPCTVGFMESGYYIPSWEFRLLHSKLRLQQGASWKDSERSRLSDHC